MKELRLLGCIEATETLLEETIERLLAIVALAEAEADCNAIRRIAMDAADELSIPLTEDQETMMAAAKADAGEVRR